MEVTIYLYGLTLGTLYERDGVISFEYKQEFINSGMNISPIKLPFNTETYTNNDDRYFNTLAGVFFDTLPDKFGTKVIERYYEKKGMIAKDLSILQKLIFIGNRGMGALEYKPSENILNSADAIDPLEIRDMYESSKKIIKGDLEQSLEELIRFSGSGASAGGARAKAVIGWNKKNNQIISGVTDIPYDYEHWLVKFDNYDDNKQSSDFTKLEYLYMSMAKECLINVPELHLFKDMDLTHFMIKRFDRDGNNKIHMHSLASMTHINFNIPMHFSYDKALRVVWLITKDKRDIQELYRRCVFNVVARNQDDHAKNTSFMMDKNGVWSLSPAYDITYANGQHYTKKHQMSIVGKVNHFKYEDLLNLAEVSDIKKNEAKKIIKTIVEVVSKFRSKAQALNIRKDLIDMVEGDLRIDIEDR